MHVPILAGSRRRTRRALLAAILPAIVAAFALPAAAGAATTVELSGTTLSYRADTEKTNTVTVSDLGFGVEVHDLRGVTARGVLCVNVDPLTVRCGLGTQRLSAFLGDRNDSITVRASFRADIDGGTGDDTYIGAVGPEPSRVTYIGGGGDDTADYVKADRAVRVSGTTFDGRIGLDEDVIFSDVERIVGSRFGDQLTSLNRFGSVSGGQGDDVLTGNSTAGAITTFDMGHRADGGDRIVPGANVNRVDYSQRTLPVNVTIGSGSFNDGERFEGDEIPLATADFGLDVAGGAAGDTLRVAPGTRFSHGLNGNGGNDTLVGAEGRDFIVGGPDSDTILAGGGNDQVRAKDGVSDVISCGAGLDDTAELDSLDGHSSCERFIGRPRLTPKTVRAAAGEPVHLRLSWRHPQSWRKLRAIELRLTRDGAPVGEITIRPRAKRIAADGAVELVRRTSRVTRKGKTVTARLALRLNPSLAGQTLKADVEATDRRGARQLERDAATVRVAR